MPRPSRSAPPLASGSEIDVGEPRVAAAIRRYWGRNVRIMAILLSIWAFVGLGCGVLMADWLNQFRLGGFPLGFWFAQQGSIVTFVLLILAYGLALNRLDSEHHREIERIRAESDAGRVVSSPS